jgi:hypothetical protein
MDVLAAFQRPESQLSNENKLGKFDAFYIHFIKFSLKVPPKLERFAREIGTKDNKKHSNIQVRLRPPPTVTSATHLSQGITSASLLV